MRTKINVSFLMLLMILALALQLQAQIVDNFNRATLGADWNADPEYQIVANTLDNTATAAFWEYLAVFNKVCNPFEVSFTWAPGGDVEGVNSGGIAMCLDAASPNANGYFIIRRYGSLDLQPIEGGEVNRTSTFSSASPTQPTPAPGNTVKVVFSTDGTGHHFDVYLNGVFDGRLTDTGKIYGNGPCWYVGVSLYGNRNNNIDDFTVRASAIIVTSPNGGEVWLANSVHNIQWNSLDFTGNVKIELSTDGGSGWSTVIASTPNTGNYSWTLPASVSSQCRIRISDAADGLPSDVSDANFEIAPETEMLTITAPNGGQTWIINTEREITWSGSSAAVIPYVRLYYSIDNGSSWTEITPSTPNDGSFTWTVPSQVTDQARIRVQDAFDGIPSDQSDNTFSISALITLRVPDASGQPGTTGNIVNVWMNNQTNVRGLFFTLTDTPDHLTALSVIPVGRATGFYTSFTETGSAVTIKMVHTSGGVMPVGNGPVAQITYNIAAGATLGTASSLDFTAVTIADANSQLVVPELVSGNFHYVLTGDLNASGTVDISDVNRAIEIVLRQGAPMTQYELLSGDVDHDGDIDLYDVLGIFDIAF